MKRIIEENLKAWLRSKNRKPLLLNGARQVGKTYILKKFGKTSFPNFHYFNFEKNPEVGKLFERDLNPKRIIDDLSFFQNGKINTKEDLLILDEIQECPSALTSLKYFQEDLPEMAICSAGSLIGVSTAMGSFPVGKVDNLTLHPMNFEEFLVATGDKSSEFFQSLVLGDPIREVVHQSLLDSLKFYLVTGGMPEVVKLYRDTINLGSFSALSACREKQKNLLMNYMRDFAKHSGKLNSQHITQVFENIPRQLAHEIEGSLKRFKFKDVIPLKARYSQLQGPIHWLINCGLAIKTLIVNKASVPLEGHCKENIFKLFLFDIGLLGQMLKLSPKDILDQKTGSYIGYFVENFVAQELTAQGEAPLYSWNEGTSQVDFLKTISGSIIPIEVKAGKSARAKSLQVYREKYNPQKAIVLSERPFNKKGAIWEIPLYLAAKI